MMPVETRPLLATVEMEPIDPTRLRATKGGDVWETVRGKRNRIGIGAPLCLLEEQPAEGGMLTADDLDEFHAEDHSFYRLNLALTLLPDEGCRFRKADFIRLSGNSSCTYLYCITLQNKTAIRCFTMW